MGGAGGCRLPVPHCHLECHTSVSPHVLAFGQGTLVSGGCVTAVTITSCGCERLRGVRLRGARCDDGRGAGYCVLIDSTAVRDSSESAIYAVTLHSMCVYVRHSPQAQHRDRLELHSCFRLRAHQKIRLRSALRDAVRWRPVTTPGRGRRGDLSSSSSKAPRARSHGPR